jgi:hypothetical protein
MSTYEFKIGDIVKVKGFNETMEYFIVTDTIDFTKKGADKPDIECEIGQIFPVTNNFEVFSLNQDRLEIVARKNMKENKMMIDFVIKERQNVLGDYNEPVFLQIIKNNLGQVATNYQPVVAPINKPAIVKPKFGEREIKKILDDTKTQDEIDAYVEHMDIHLSLLHTAIENNDEDDINFQKTQLEKVRQRLMELEYFQLEKRRSGVSIKIK